MFRDLTKQLKIDQLKLFYRQQVNKPIFVHLIHLIFQVRVGVAIWKRNVSRFIRLQLFLADMLILQT